MRVLHIAAANSTAGGGEKHVADCLREMSSRKVQLGLVAPEGGDLGDIAHAVGASYYPAPIGHGFGAPRTAIVRDAIANFAPDIIHAHGHRAALFARRADPNGAQRIVYTFHGIHVDRGLLSPPKMTIEHLLKSRVAAFVAVSQADKEKAIRLGIANAEKIFLVNNGIPAPKEVPFGTFRECHGIGIEEQMLLTVARISKQKNLPGLLRIFEKTATIFEMNNLAIPRLVMICPGEEIDYRHLQESIAAHPYGQHITLLPRQNELATAYNDADLFVFSSLWEGRPYVLAETLSYGTPVVGYKIDGNVETVNQGKSGILVDINDEQAFAEAIFELLTSQDKLDEYGAFGAKDMSEHYSLNAMIDKLLSIYQGVIDTRGK